MSSPDASELSLTTSTDAAIQAILDALPKDTVVRDEDDGVGRFAGQRTVAIIGRDRRRLMLFEGTWGSLKPRLSTPQVDVLFAERPSHAAVRVVAESEPAAGIGARVGDFVNRALTVAVVVVGYHWIRSTPIDYAQVAGIAAVGGLAWSVIAMFMPSKERRGLADVTREALAPLVAEPSAAASESESSRPAGDDGSLDRRG